MWCPAGWLIIRLLVHCAQLQTVFLSSSEVVEEVQVWGWSEPYSLQDPNDGRGRIMCLAHNRLDL